MEESEKRMNQYDILQRIPYNSNYTYESRKEIFLDDLEEYLEFTHVIGSVNSVIEDCYILFEQNGMEKLILVIAIMLFLIEHDEMDDRKAFSSKWDLLDFETGNYDDLFTEEDLVAIKKDVAFINEYFAKHPELIEGVEEKRSKVQAPINYKHRKPDIDTKIIITDYQYDFLKPLIPDLDEFLEKSDYSGLLNRIRELVFRKYYNDDAVKQPLEEIDDALFLYNRGLLD